MKILRIEIYKIITNSVMMTTESSLPKWVVELQKIEKSRKRRGDLNERTNGNETDNICLK
jgi:hypothetical protein